MCRMVTHRQRDWNGLLNSVSLSLPQHALTCWQQRGKVLAMKWSHSWAAMPLSFALMFSVGACQGLRPLAEVERDGAGQGWLCEGSDGGWGCVADGESKRSPRTPSEAPRVADQAQTPRVARTKAEPVPATTTDRRQAEREASARRQEQAATPRSDKAPSRPRDRQREALASPSNEAAAPPPPRPAAATPAPPPPRTELPLYRQLAHGGDALPDLLALPAHFFVLQLIAMPSQELLDNFAIEQGLRNTVSTRIARDGEILYVLLAGVYEDQHTAERALVSLPPEVRALRPWIRPLGLLQRAMRQVDAGAR